MPQLKTTVQVMAAGLASLLLLSGCQGTGENASSTATRPVAASTTTAAAGTAAQTTGAQGSAATAGPSAAGSKATVSRTAAVTRAPTKKPSVATKPKPKEFTMKQSDFVRNAAVWQPPLLRESGFVFEVEMSSIGALSRPLLQMSVKKHQLGETASAIPAVRAHEWGYSATHIATGGTDGNNETMNNTFLDNPPSTRREALTSLKNFLMNQYIRGRDHDWAAMNGHYPWHHYAGEFGFDAIGSEIGENIRNYQVQIAMNRGAARQYHKPWYIDFSAWHGAGITDYCSTPIWGGNSGADKGHSLSLFERSLVMSYMAGAGSVVAEAGAAISFYDTMENNLYKLSPYGEVCRDFNAFTKAHADVGVSYSPIGVVLDYYHGSYMGGDNKKAFHFFDYTAGDHMTWSLFDMLWPGAWTDHLQGNERGTLVNNAYGDYVDALLQNASQEVLNAYPCLVLTGDIQLSAAEKARYKAYVEQGGTLVLNTAYLEQFPEYKGTLNAAGRYDKTVGKGKVIVYGDAYKVDKLAPILKELVAKYVPFTVSAPIQQLVNVKDGSLFVTLINNDGVTKTSQKKAVVDASKAKTLTVTYTGPLTPKAVKDIYNGKALALSGKQTTVQVGPGEVAVLEFVFD